MGCAAYCYNIYLYKFNSQQVTECRARGAARVTGFGGEQESTTERDAVHMVGETVKELLPKLTQSWRTSREKAGARFEISRITTHAMRYTGDRERFECMFPHGTGFQMPWTDARKGLVKLGGLAQHPMIDCADDKDLAAWVEVLVLENRHKRAKHKEPIYKFWKIGRGSALVEIGAWQEIVWSGNQSEIQSSEGPDILP